MLLSKCNVVLLAGFSLWLSSAARADNPPAYGGGFAGPPAPQSWQPAYQTYQQSVPPAPSRPDSPPLCDQRPVDPHPAPFYQPSPTPFFGQPEPASRAQYPLPDASWSEPISLPISQPQTPPGVPAAPSATWRPVSYVPPFQGVLPPPHIAPESVPAGQSVNGTWRDEGDCVVIEVNGQQLRLAKSALGQQQAGPPSTARIAMGSVHGRLLQNGRPLTNCTVVIVPMHKDGAADDIGIRQPLSTVTDADGVYGFENAPVGSYKLTWLPAGTEQWIRRIEMKPDVFVHEGQEVTVKDIRTALRTIN
jgi:hypothetical protein